MLFSDLPKEWRGININLKNKESVADLTDKYTINFSYNKFNDDAVFFIPKLTDNRFSMNGYNYIVWHRLCKPIVNIEYLNNIHTLIINHILSRPDRPENYDLIFNIKDNELVCTYKEKEYNIQDSYLHDLLYSYWITPSDRIILNQYINSDNLNNYLTKQDLDNIKEILLNNPDYVTNWKELESLRVIGLEDLVISMIMLSLPNVLRDFFKNGTINSDILTNNIRSFLSTDAPEIRLDLNETKIASYAQNKKVILPFDNYCNVNELIPDPSWYKYIDMLDAPQSIKIGSVGSFIGDVVIQNKQLIIGSN